MGEVVPPKKGKWLWWLQNERKRVSMAHEQNMITKEKRLKLLRQDLVNRIDPKLKAQLRWLEQWDIDSVFSENADLANSQAALAIPLVDMAVSPSLHISLSMSYTSGDVSSNGILGNGWNMHNVAQDFIVVDHKQSMFSHNHEFQLSIEGQLVTLVASKENPNEFTIEGNSDIKLTFQKTQNRWIIDTPNMKSVYGTPETVDSDIPAALQWSLHWPNWRGPGTDERSLKEEVIAWYMVSREDKHGLKRKVYYKYLMESRPVSNNQVFFTSAIQLESVFDSENKFLLNLIYDDKNREEYKIKAYKDPQGIIQFPVHLMNSHYLVGFHLEMEEYQQQLQFGYDVVLTTGVRKLSSVYQVFNENGGAKGVDERIFYFNYDHIGGPREHLLTQVEIPTYNSSLHYTYDRLQIPLLRFETESLNTLRIPAVDNLQIGQGEDFGTMSYDLGTGGIYVDVFNKQFTKYVTRLYTKATRRKSSIFPGTILAADDPKKIKRFATVLFPGFIAVLEETGEEKRLYTFAKNEDTHEWPRVPNGPIRMSKDALFRNSDKLIVISKNVIPGQLTVLQPMSKEDGGNENGYKEHALQLSNNESQKVDRLIVQDDVILAYNGNNLHGWRTNSEKREDWKETIICNVKSMHNELFNKFEHKNEKENIFEQMNVMGLHLQDNQILLTALKWIDGNSETGVNAEIITNAHLILVDENLNRVYEEVKQVKGEKILELKRSGDIEGTTMHFRYKYDKDAKKFIAYLENMEGELVDKTCKEADDKAKCKKELLEAYNDSEDFKESMKEMMMFDMQAFTTFQLEPTGASTNSTKYVMTGSGWSSQNLTDQGTMKVGTGYIFETVENKTSSETGYALYRQNPEDASKYGAKLGEWKINSQNSSMSVGDPSYLAMQPDLNYQPELVVLRGEDDEQVESIQLGDRGEKLLRMSNHETLFTLIDSSNPENPSFNKKLIARRVNSIVPSTPIWALTKSEVISGKESRMRKYENEFSCNSIKKVQENVIRVLPAEDRSYSGYYEEITVVPIEAPGNATKSQNWYDSKGQLVVTKDVESQLEAQEESQAKTDEDEETKKWYRIWDVTGQLEVADIAPFNVTSQEIAYFGFEPYENNTWSLEYPSKSVISGEVSLTGTSMLRLQSGSGDKMKVTLTPENQQGTYVASTWLRYPINDTSSPAFEFESPVENFKAYLSTHTGHQLMGVYGQMKRQRRDWIFAEVVLDLDKIRNNVYSEFYRYSDAALNLPSPSSTNFTITLEMESGNNGSSFSSWIDVDHLRFAPIDLDWTVKVYDTITGVETEMILGDGAILRKIYNQFSTEISTLDEYGQVEQFKSLSRSGFIFPPPSSDNLVGIQENRREVVIIPEQGSYEMFDDFSLKNIWSLDSQANKNIWGISKGRVVHLSDQPHQLSVKSPEVLFDPIFSAVRMHLHFASLDSSLSISLNGLPNLIQFQGDGTLDIANGCRLIENLPSSGELLFHVTDEAMWLWLDGVLLFDRKLDRSCLGNVPNTPPWNDFIISIKGPITVSHIITMMHPQINVEFYNAWGDRTQVVQMESSEHALVTETIYDEMGRDAIKTKSVRLTRSADYTPMLNYYSDFVKNRYPSDINSIFKVGTVDGLANQLNPQDEGYPYSRTLYQDDMLREVSVEGMPGKVFSTFGTFNKKHSRHSDLPFLEILFPVKNGFREKVTYEPSGNLKVTVLDSKQNEVAQYVKVTGYDNILTIYEYNEKGKLVKMLPPKYHAHMRTYLRTTPWEFGEAKLTEDEKYWQGIFGTYYSYNELDQLAVKKAPFHKTKGFLYDAMGNIRFMYTFANPDNANGTIAAQDQIAEDIVYMLHAGPNKPVEVGYFRDPVSVGTLQSYQNGTDIPPAGEAQIHQKIIYSETHSDPELRGKVRLFLTYDNPDFERSSRPGARSGESGGQPPPHQEVLKFNSANHVIMKTSNAVHTDTFTNYQKHYRGNKLREMSYPRGKFDGGLMAGNNETAFNLIHTHDKMGRLTALGTRSDPSTFAQILYNPAGQVEDEVLEMGTLSNSSRRYEYNSPGLLTRISDPFLTQQMSFLDGGYGQSGHGDGILMSNVMAAAWSQISQMTQAQRNWFTLPVDDFADDRNFKMCLQALKRIGVLDPDTNIPLKFLTEAMVSQLPLTCAADVGLKLMNLVAKYLPPTANYGHSYSYGSHQELTRAKFFGDADKESTRGPLRLASFLDDIPELGGLEEAEAIWDVLSKNQYLLVDNVNPEDKMAAIGKEGLQTMFRHSKLMADLVGVDPSQDVFAVPIMKLLYEDIDKQEMIALEDFQITFLNWYGYLDDPNTPDLLINRAKQAAAAIYTMLQEKEYLSKNLDLLLTENYLNVMSSHRHVIGPVTRLLTAHFAAQLGTNIYDFESYYLDPNGNRLMFYQGLNRYELEYEDDASSRVKRLKIRDYGGADRATEFEHDSQGNVNKAGHKGIQLIKYHPVTNRPVLIVLEDGRRILIKYDAQGERLLKRVFAPTGNKLLSETKYLRDENGRVLMDKLTKFDGEDGQVVQELESTYLYGPRGHILGFYRNGKYYSVFTDHAGSTRLITHMGQVVAGYDYWPYGEMIRSFGEENCHLVYRFTGQEYDEETQLYNYHARIYDPTIGRFFQPDPKSQYPSPYVYGGNSPVSLVDPDGEFFFLLCVIVGAVVGGFLAGASANGSWNPLKWNWKSLNTWMAIFGGAIGGALLPGAIGAAVALIGIPATILVGLGGSYIKMAMANGSFNPGAWDWTSPATYNAFLEGFSAGVSVGPGLVKNVKAISKDLSKIGQIIFSTAKREIAGGVAMAYISGSLANGNNFKFWEWDWSDPNTYSAIYDGFSTGRQIGQKVGSGLGKVNKKFADMTKTPGAWKNILKDMSGSSKMFLKDIFKNVKHPLWKTAGKAVVSYVANALESGEWDITKWDWHSKSTYEGLLNYYKASSEIKRMARDWDAVKSEWKDGPARWKEQMAQRPRVRPVLAKALENMDKYYEFYARLPIPFYRRKGGFGHLDAIQVALKMFLDLNKDMFLEEQEEDDPFRLEMKQILGGIRAGTTLFPVISEEIAQLIDCEGVDKQLRNGTRVGGAFEKCSIGSADGITARQNRELVRKMFVPSKLYQSKQDFVPVNLATNSDEFPQHILQMFHNEKNDYSFYASFFLGTIFHSILNTGSRNNKPQLFFLQESIQELNQNAIHVAMVTENDGKSILHVRSIFGMTMDKFQGQRDNLAGYMKKIRYECYLPSDMNSVHEVHGESIVLASSQNGTDLHIMTPDYLAGGNSCGGGESGSFFRIPELTSENVFENFSKFVEESTEAAEERESRYKDVVQALATIRNQAGSILESPEVAPLSFIPFVYGLLQANLKQTYDISMALSKSKDSLHLVAQRNSKGQQTWQGFPGIISADESEQHFYGFLHKSALLSISKQALIGSVSKESLVTVGTVSLPKFEGLLDRIFYINEAKIEQAIRFLYFNHHIATNVLPPQASSQNNLHFVSNFILGEFLSKMETSPWEMYVMAPEKPDAGSSNRLQAQRLFFVRNPETDKCIILNIIESSKLDADGHYEFDPTVAMEIPSVPDVEIGSLEMIKIIINPKSVDGWDMSDTGGSDVPKQEQVFLQSVDRTVQDSRFLEKDPTAYLKLGSPFAGDPSSTLDQLSFNKDYITEMFGKLKENRLQQLVNVDLDLQSVVMGLLMGASLQLTPDADGISMALRQFVSEKDSFFDEDAIIPTKLSLLSVANGEVVIPQSEQVLLASLKAVEENNGGNATISEKFEEATEEIKEYQCSVEERLKEAFKVSRVPAVYDSSQITEGGGGDDRVYFEVDPEILQEMNCTAPENPFREYLREKGQESGQSKAQPEGYFGFWNKTISQYFYGNQAHRDHPAFPEDANIDKCHLGAWNDGKYSVDGISCYSGKSKIAVFRHIQPNDLVTVTSRGEPFNLVGDTYKKGACSPITFNGKPSVACEGDKTTLIYTPHHETRPFDELDGNLMLARVAVHFGGKLWSFVRHGGSSSPRNHANHEDHMVTQEMMSDWERDITNIQTALGSWEKSAGDVEWAKMQLEECKGILDNMTRDGSRGDMMKAKPEMIEEITERLQALQEDLTEQIMVSKVETMFGGGAKIVGSEMADRINIMNQYPGNMFNPNSSQTGVGTSGGYGLN